MNQNDVLCAIIQKREGGVAEPLDGRHDGGGLGQQNKKIEGARLKRQSHT